ncbi:hypothetical protein ACSSS7_007207 [Eimeria intestinalis]
MAFLRVEDCEGLITAPWRLGATSTRVSSLHRAAPTWDRVPLGSVALLSPCVVDARPLLMLFFSLILLAFLLLIIWVVVEASWGVCPPCCREERVAPAAVSARQAAATEQPEQHQQQQEQQQQQQETEEAEAAEEDQAKTLQVQYQARRLSPAAQDALLSGHDPIVLIDELKRLRMQVVSVLNDKRTEALVPLVEPVTGKPSGASLLTEHLSAVSAQLQQALQQQGEGGTISVSSGTPTAGSGPTSAWSKGFREADTLSAGGDSRGGGPAHAQMNYEVYCIPSVGRVIEQGRVTALERRLALVENKMGLHKMSLLPHPDLFEAVTHMQQRVKLLDPQKIEALQKRVQSLLLELHALQQRRHELDVAAEAPSSAIAGGAAKAVGGTPSGGHRVVGGPPHSGGSAAASDWQRVEELYELCERWKAPAAVLPSVLERLKLLKGIHQEAGGVSVRLSVLEKQQEELQAWVRKADAAVSQLQRTVLESIQWAQATVEQMQQRLRAVAGAPPPPPPLAPAAAAAADA